MLIKVITVTPNVKVFQVIVLKMNLEDVKGIIVVMIINLQSIVKQILKEKNVFG